MIIALLILITLILLFGAAAALRLLAGAAGLVIAGAVIIGVLIFINMPTSEETAQREAAYTAERLATEKANAEFMQKIIRENAPKKAKPKFDPKRIENLLDNRAAQSDMLAGNDWKKL